MNEIQSQLPLVAVTMGDPAGIGPEIIAMALQQTNIRPEWRILVVGDETSILNCRFSPVGIGL